ncbi:MAG TPA: glycoside hydrolase family 32 protein, partial [Bryobacteraceae bacterium]|jgi:fructan beta-fructosidase
MKDFRDPKVFWYAPGKYWVMVVALPNDHKIRFYKSPNLKAWDLLSEFGPAGATGGQWECPDLFPLPVEGKAGEKKWMLSVNINPGGLQGGSADQYFVGEFDGTHFTNANAPNVTLWADYGADFYASTSFSDIPAKDGRRIWIGWLSNWIYANDEPTSPWRGLQSFPRVLSLRDTPDGLRLVQKPVAEIEKLRQRPLELRNVTIEEANRKLADFHGQSYEIELNGTADVQVLKDPDHETVVSTNGTIHIDRTDSGNVAFHKGFAAVHRSVPARDARLRIFVDRSVIDVFGNNGATVMTERVFPPESATGLQLSGPPSNRISLTIWKMASAWK